MNIFTIFFLQNCSKIHSRKTKLHHYLKFSRGSMPPNPPNKRVLRHALHGTKRYANRLTFLKINLDPPPPTPEMNP